jgi:hypothetical protein
MKTFLSIVGLLALASGLAWSCGDKYLVRCTAPGRDVAALSKVPSNIVIYAPEGVKSTDTLLSYGLDQELVRHGHRVHLVRTEAELQEVLRGEPVDLVMADCKLLDDLPASPARLPVVDETDKDRLPQLRQKYADILKTPGTKTTILSTIEYALQDLSKKAS